MEPPAHKFYLVEAGPFYKILVVGLLPYSLLFIYTYLKISLLTVILGAAVVFFWLVLVRPLTLSGKPAYIVANEGIRQKRNILTPELIPWESIDGVTSPGGRKAGDMNRVNISGNFRRSPLVIDLSGLQDPFMFLEMLEHWKPFGLDRDKARDYLRRHMDREKFLYITVAYSLSAVPVLLLASYYMRYILLEDNVHNTLWGSLFAVHWMWSTLMSFVLFKNRGSRFSFISISCVVWMLILLGPFMAEKNIYYNMRAIQAEKAEKYSEAETYIRKAIELNPQGVTYYETLGKALFGLGDYYASMDAFLYLLENDKKQTDYFTAYYHLWIGKSLLKLGRAEEAKKELGLVKDGNSKKLNDEVKGLLEKSQF